MNLPSLQQAIKCTFIVLDIDNTYYLEWQYGNCQIVKWQKCRDNKQQGAVNAMGKGDCHFQEFFQGKAESAFQLLPRMSCKETASQSGALTSRRIGIREPKDLHNFGGNAPENH